MARIEIRIPELGETIREGVITRWMKQPGERVAADEAVLEVGTDKADFEAAAPAAGVLASVRVREGEVVRSGDVVGEIETETFGWTAPPPAPEPASPAAACLRCGRAMEPANARGWVPSGVRPLVCRACGHVELLADDPRSF
jgi:2-oxoglutarate dehydrogenase E2 component (dihydrolipoamide succinyltransferase)